MQNNPFPTRAPSVTNTPLLRTPKGADPHADIAALATEIDQLVYALYDLTKKEIGAITNS